MNSARPLWKAYEPTLSELTKRFPAARPQAKRQPTQLMDGIARLSATSTK